MLTPRAAYAPTNHREGWHGEGSEPFQRMVQPQSVVYARTPSRWLVPRLGERVELGAVAQCCNDGREVPTDFKSVSCSWERQKDFCPFAFGREGKSKNHEACR